MNVAKWLLLAILALPVAELVVFILVAATIGFGLALLLVIATSFAGACCSATPAATTSPASASP